MQARFLVEVLVLQAERLVRGPLGMAVAVMNKLSPRVIAPFPKEFALAVCHFSRHADLVAVEVVDGMLCVFTLFITLRQRLIAVGMGVNVSESAVGFQNVFNYNGHIQRDRSLFFQSLSGSVGIHVLSQELSRLVRHIFFQKSNKPV